MVIFNRQDLEQFEDNKLAEYACKAKSSLGREFKEDEHDIRTCFQRDRDRIVHSKAFRRLEYKTQVFVNHEGDHYRTRLTHSLEVAQISRTVARNLGLNEDLAECIALAHDLGHPPFGHSGEKEMNELMQNHGGFEHNRQSLRIVTWLEKRSSHYPGLNLSLEVLEGLSKHFSEYDLPEGRHFNRDREASLEAQLVNFCDEIAYNNHDLDDGLRSGLINLKQLEAVELWQSHFLKLQTNLKDASEQELRIRTIAAIINELVTDLLISSHQSIETQGIKNLDDVYQRGKNIIRFSPEVKKKNVELKRFLFKNLYRHWRVERMADKAARVIRSLFEAFTSNPQIVPSDLSMTKDEKEIRHICDYIASMTDRYALEEYKKLFDPEAKV